MDITGKIALVTGGGTGLGRAICLELAKSGMKIAINYSRSEVEAHQTAADVRALGSGAMIVKADVSSSSDISRMVEEVREAFGGLDIVVPNAGTTVFKDFSNLDGVSEEDWDHIMAVNVRGVWLTVRAAAPYLKANGWGRVVVVTSVAGIKPHGSSLPYAVSKAASNHLTRGLAKALAPDVLVNAVAPGLLETRWIQGHNEHTKQGFINDSPLHRIPTVEDCARQVRLLIETDSMTGTIIPVDAGSSL